jgi:hypothetical protein
VVLNQEQQVCSDAVISVHMHVGQIKSSSLSA